MLPNPALDHRCDHLHGAGDVDLAEELEVRVPRPLRLRVDVDEHAVAAGARQRDGEVEGRARTLLALGPERSTHQLDQPLGPLDGQLGHDRVVLGRPVEGRGDDLALHRPLHVGDLFRALVDEHDAALEIVRTWLDIRAAAEKSKPATLVHKDLDLVQRILRDQLSDDFAAIRVDSEEEYEAIVEFINRIQPRMVKRVKLYTRERPILESYGVQAEIDKAIKPRVWLKSGGYLVINQTEALVAIDVNTGRFVGSRSKSSSGRLEDTITANNLEAVKEIVRQVRLRDLGGIIVLDLIDIEAEGVDVAPMRAYANLMVGTETGDDAAVDLVKQIARMPSDPRDNRPLRPVKINHISIVKAGSDAAATSAKPAPKKPATLKPSAPTSVPPK